MSAVAFAFGAIVGSFLNVVIARMPYGESIVTPRSRCPHCKTPIPGHHNIPILSWLILLGRCSTCRHPISIRYPLTELLTGALFLASFRLFFPNGLQLLAAALFVSGLVVVTFVDLDIWEIPDEVTLPGIVVGAALRPLAFGTSWWDGILGAALGGGSFWLVRVAYQLLRGREGMGMGDIKLMGMLGAFLGPSSLVPIGLYASVSGLVAALVDRLRTRKDTTEAVAITLPVAEPAPDAPAEDDASWTPPPGAIPFGPFLALGGLVVLFFPTLWWHLIRSLH
jgi:leader peptidase (prepilin peptidase) / N-methyltransferase